MHRTLPSSSLPVPVQPAERDCVVPAEELLGLRDRYPNVLIAGPKVATVAAVNEIYPLLRLPITSVHVDSCVALPLTLTDGTLILSDIAALNRTEQARLHEWIARTSGATQVVATSAMPVFPLVEQGAFLDVLYYRLNTTYLEVGGLGSP